MPAYIHTLLRTISPVVADPDWESTQVAPDPSICIDLTGTFEGAVADELGIVCIADTGGAVVDGTVSVQAVEVSPTTDIDRPSLVVGGALEVNLPTGREFQIPVGFRKQLTVRLVGASAPVLAAGQLKIYWRRVS